MFEVAGGIIIAFATIALVKKINKYFDKRKATKTDYTAAAKEYEELQNFLADEERVKRWKAVQFKCQFFANSYNGDKKSGVPELTEEADKELEKWISGRLDEAFAIQNDEYCRSAMFDSIAELMAKVGQFERAYKTTELIKIGCIKNRSLEKLADLRIRTPSAA